jgi:hypothetical protein
MKKNIKREKKYNKNIFLFHNNAGYENPTKETVHKIRVLMI